MMLKRGIGLVTLLLTLCAFSQSEWDKQQDQELSQARVLFEYEDWYASMLMLEDLYQVDSSNAEVNYLLGTCYLNQKGYEYKAIPLLEYAHHEGITEAFFELARAYHGEGLFDFALKTFQYYKVREDKNRTNDEVDRYIQITRDAIDQYANPSDVRIENLGSVVNSEHHEYVPLISNDGEILYFTSRRPGGVGNEKDPNDQYFEDIYYAIFSEGHWSSPENMGKGINTNTHDATVGISANGDQMIIYRTNENLTGGDLYITKREDNSWSKPEKLGESINTEYQEPSACLSADGSTIYFSSNRPDGYGGKDIYRVKLLPTGDWSLPMNLGPTVNTKYDEDAPFLSEDGTTLYFASNGHHSIGGYDIFRSYDDGGVWSVPENIGYPVNTVDDDIYFSMAPSGKVGYYSSERADGYGGQDLYKVYLIGEDANLIVVSATITDSTAMGVRAKVTLVDEETRKLEGIYTSNAGSGKFIMIISPETRYQIIIEAEGYHPIVEYTELSIDDDTNQSMNFEMVQIE